MAKTKIFTVSESFASPIITLGGDPEFEIRQLPNWEVVDANRVLEDPDRVNPVGLDGASHTAELRPAPSSDPTVYVENVGDLIRDFAESLSGKGCVPSIRGDRYPLGGHIHIGGKADVRYLLKEEAHEIVPLLDLFIGELLLPTAGPARGSYSYLGAWEEKPWGFEYRTPPASFYHHPEMVRVVYKLTKGLLECLLCEGEMRVEVDNGLPSFKEYCRFLTQDEAVYLLSFPERWKEQGGELDYRAWGIEAQVPRLVISFSDGWAQPQKSLYERALREALEPLIEAKGGPLRVILYGLKKARGFVYALPTVPEELRSAEFPRNFNPSQREFWIGLPWEVRMERLPSEEEVRAFVDWVVEAIFPTQKGKEAVITVS